MLRRLQVHSDAIRSRVKRLVGPRRPKPGGGIERPAFIPNHWHAVCVDAKPLSCVAAHELRRKRFLSKEAPSLPLEGCSSPSNCPCTYKHHEDRRGKKRRKGEASFTSTQKIPKKERRESRGRRSDD
jgi:hypothetical protein